MAREKVITLKLSVEEHRQYKKLAKGMGLTVSSMLRALVVAHEKSQKMTARHG